MERPRKPLDGNEEFSISQLAMIPLKRRLEILFASNIIPSRRQLALKYELPEQIIHNVLSHRKYLLENWKYNAEARPLLSKLELENAMALTELLIEWKRRVQMNGLQITDAALTRKAIYLQRALNGSDEGLGQNWWNQFDINWVYKQFQDYENDSLDMEDILNDLQWMFAESTFQRLLEKFRQSKIRLTGTGGLARARREELLAVVKDENPLDDDSDIQVDPNYYNDDDFECEDYEFVLDEEVVIDALRKELEDLEQTKYQQYLLGSYGQEGGVDHFVSQDELDIKEESNSHEEEEEDAEQQQQVQSSNVNLIEEQHVNLDIDKMDNSDDDIAEKINLICGTEPKLPTVSTALDNLIIKHENTKTIMDEPKTELSIEVPAVSLSSELIEPACAPPPKRKPRNLHAVVSLRKDCVRLPAAADIAQLARKQCLEQLLQESDDLTDDDDDMDLYPNQKRRKRKKYAHSKSRSIQLNSRSKKSKAKKTGTAIAQLSPNITDSFIIDSLEIENNPEDMGIEFDIIDNDLKSNFNFDSYDDDVDDVDDVKEEMISSMASDIEEFIVESNQIMENIAAETFSSSSEHPIDDDSYEQNNNDSEKFIENQLYMINEELGATKTRRCSSNKKLLTLTLTSTSTSTSTSQSTLKKLANDLEEEQEQDFILGESLSLNYEDQYRETQRTKLDLEDIEEEISGTAIQTKECLNDSDLQSATATATATMTTTTTETETETEKETAIAIAAKHKITSSSKSIKNSNKKLVRVAKSQPKQKQKQKQQQSVPSNFNPKPNLTPNPFKRAKRRTDGSDLTLRKDKVRLSLVHLINDRETTSSLARMNSVNETDVQMVFEPYMGDG